MNILVWIIFGALVGWVASIVLHRDERQGLLGDIALGIAGAIVGGIAVSLLGGMGITGFNLYSFVVALFGAIGVVWLGRAIKQA